MRDYQSIYVTAVLRADLAVTDCLIPVRVNNSLSNDLVSTKPGPYFGPRDPIGSAKKQDANTDNWEHVVGIALCVPVRGWWDEGHNGQKDVGEKENNCNGKISVERRCPVLRLAVVQIDETSSNEAVDPSSWIGIATYREETLARIFLERNCTSC
jgi:hypothetical protein